MDLAPRRAGSVPEAAASNSIAVENRPLRLADAPFDMSDFGTLPEPRLPSLDHTFAAAL
jgi:hypothetical protein